MDLNSLSSDRFSTFCFFMMGLLVFFPSVVVIWIGTEDILSGSTLSTAIIILSFSLPDTLSRLCSPSLVSRIPFTCSMVLQSLLTTGSLLTIVLVHSVDVRIIGVSILGIPYGLGIITCLRMAAYYDNADNLSSAFILGSNVAAFVSSIGYTGLTTWAGVAPRTIIACCIPVSFMPLVFYALLDKQPLTSHYSKTSTNYQDIKYTTLQETSIPENRTVGKKIVHEIIVLFKVFPFVAYYFISNFTLHNTIVAVLSTLTFPTAPFPPRDHYQYYRLIGDAGILFGGMELVLASCLSKKCLELFKIKRVWILVVLNSSCLIFFVSASWYRFLPNVYVVFALVFIHGVIHGCIRVQAIALGASNFKTPQDKGTAMGYMEIGISIGRVTAGILGLFVERYLREHCTNRLLLGKYCLARIPSPNGWYKNVH